MAILTNNSSGLFTASSTWSVISPVGFSTALATQEIGVNATSIAFASSLAFTPGAITIDGIGLKLSVRTASGTASVRLAQAGVPVAGTTVTCNVVDLPNGLSWVFFKFAAPVTLAAATLYTVQISTSVASAATFFRKSATASDWTFYLRTTTNQAPAATDTFITTGDITEAGLVNSYTVTMDNTTTTIYGIATTGAAAIEVSAYSTFSYGTSAATNYRFRVAGDVFVSRSGSLVIGDQTTPIPSSSTALLEFVNTINVQFGLQARLNTNGVITTYGAVKQGRALLAANAAATATSITSDTSTNWLSGDSVALSSTTKTVGETELKTLTGNATGTSIPIAALSFAHSGTNPTRAHLINLTRNVVIRGTSVTLQAYILVNNTNIVNMNYTEIAFMGSGTGSRRGIDINITTGFLNMLGCSLRNFEVANSIGITLGNAIANTTIEDCVFYRMSVAAISTGVTSTTSVIVNNCWAFTNLVANNTLISLNNPSGTYSNIVAVSSTSGGFVVNSNTAVGLVYSNFNSHSNAGNGIQITHNSQTTTPLVITNSVTWMNSGVGFIANSLYNCEVNGITAFSNTSINVSITNCFETKFRNMVINAGATLSAPTGLSLSSNNAQVYVDSSSFGASQAHSSSDLFINATRVYQDVTFRNCLFSSTTEILNQINMSVMSAIGSSQHDQVVGSQRMWKKFGTITLDSTFFAVQAPSQRLTPNTAGQKLNTQEKRVAVPLGRTVRISTNVRKSVAGDGSAYNGTQPRLILIADPSSGIATDTVLATSTAAGNGAFELLSGTTAAVTSNTVLRFYVDCDGTAGFINIDRWSVEII